jgi:hypothetical protein
VKDHDLTANVDSDTTVPSNLSPISVPVEVASMVVCPGP